MAKRSLNRCKSCGDTWYPKGRDLSRKCPNCGSTDIAYAGGGCGAILFLLILVAVVFAVFPRSKNESATPPAEPTPSQAIVSQAPEEPTQPPPTPNEFPKNVVAAKDLNVKLEHGSLGIKRGQPFVLQGRVPEGYQATYGSIKFTVHTGDFQEAPP
jgi:hypothetical protein